MKIIVLCSAAVWLGVTVLLAREAQHRNAPAVNVVQNGDPAQDYRQCRRMLVGPGVNQPDPYPGYGGFVGWQSPIVLQDGTILCSLFTYPGPSGADLARDPDTTTLTGIIRSFDNGRIWEQEPKRLPVSFVFDATDGPIIQLQNGSALICVYGRTVDAQHDMVAFCRSTDSGANWEFLSTVSADHEMSETAVAQLSDGRLVLIARPEGDIAWSRDGGRSWTKPAAFGIRLFEPRLLTLRDGTLLCLHGSYAAGGFRAMFSVDSGATWTCPDAKWGFPVDPSVYGYGQAVELSDGSVWAAYIHTGGHSTKDAKTEALWSIRLRVRPSHDGIDLLPAPGA